MPQLDVSLDGDNCWVDFKGEVIDAGDHIRVAGLWKGMRSGKPSVAFRIDLPDGKSVIAQTSLELFLTAADMLKAHYGDPRK